LEVALKIFNDGFEIYKSGALFVPNLKESKFVLAEAPNRLEVIFRVEKIEGQEPLLTQSIENEFTLAFIFTNPPHGVYSHASPQRIGHIDGRELYAAFHVEIMGEYQAYNLTYTFFVKEVVHG
jgi:hypothetical protein